MAILNSDKNIKLFLKIALADKNIDNLDNFYDIVKKNGLSLSIPLTSIRIKIAKFMPW